MRFAAEATLNPANGKKAEKIGRTIVKKALTDENPTVRTEAFKALVRLDMHGDEEAIADRIQAHRDAGADHVCIQPLRPDGGPGPDERVLEALAPAGR